MTHRLADLSTRAFVERLATSDPVPGGGSAAALAGAMGAALIHMVVTLTASRPTSAEHEAELGQIARAAVSWQSELLNLMEVDAAAYDAVVRARRLPRGSEVERRAREMQIAAATREATRVPVETAARAADVLALAERLAPIGSVHAISDVGVGALLAAAAVRGAAMNVRINLPYLGEDDPLRAEAAARIDGLLADLDRREVGVRSAVEERMG